MSEIHGATGSYAADALDPDELDEFEAHLAVCPTCRQEVVEFCETAAQLSLLAAAPPPPPGLREAVLSGITEVRQLPPEEGTPRPAVTEDRPDPPAAPAPVAVDHDPVVDELALRRASRRARVLSVLVAAVTVVALALGGVVYSLARSQQAPVAGPPPTATVPQVDPSLLAAPDARIYSTTVNGAAASFVVSKSQNRAAFVSTDLPAPTTGNVYHLWTLKGSIVRPDNVFSGGGQATQVFSGPVNDSTNLAINVEPAGTTPQAPTTPVLAAVKI